MYQNYWPIIDKSSVPLDFWHTILKNLIHKKKRNSEKDQSEANKKNSLLKMKKYTSYTKKRNSKPIIVID